MSRLLDQGVQTLPGIGPVASQILRQRGYPTVGELLWLFPRRYEDQRKTTPIGELSDGDYAVVRAEVRSTRYFGRTGRQGFEAVVCDAGGTPEGQGAELKLLWFRARPGLAKQFCVGTVVRVAGSVRQYRGELSIAHPELLRGDGEGAIEPRYPDIPGLGVKTVRRAVRAAVDRASQELPDLLPLALRTDARLHPVGEAIRRIHAPSPELDDEALERLRDGNDPAHRRLALEELLLWELALRSEQRKRSDGHAEPFPAEGVTAALEAAVPFSLTSAQRDAIDAIGRDLEQPKPMRRLLQGDVGCGKTAVAMAACHQVARHKAQAAFLAPTELLAEQHAGTLAPIAESLGLKLVLFTGALSKDARRSALDRLSTGAADLVVGTHALLSAEVQFARLGLVVVDEQHRFGVAQRLQLGRRRGQARPHLLVMTATPIPRSLALVLYAGLELTTIGEKPPGRTPPVTRMLPRSKRSAVLRHIERALAAEGRAYVICPAVSASEEVVGVDQVFREMSAALGEDRVGFVHGQVTGGARRQVMQAFASAEIQVLVGTTVLEVGVDVPSANIIVIEQAERFGLAQLHQLRGRVGRSGQRSACLLTHDEPISDEAKARLTSLCETDDGFVLAERDLELRGPGQLFGYRQSGGTGLRFASLTRDASLLAQAADFAQGMLARDPDLSEPAHAVARAAVERWASQQAVREESG